MKRFLEKHRLSIMVVVAFSLSIGLGLYRLKGMVDLLGLILAVVNVLLLAFFAEKLYSACDEKYKPLLQIFGAAFLVLALMIYRIEYVGIMSTQREASVLLFLLSIALILFYEQTWLVLPFCALAVGITPMFALEYLPWVAFVLWMNETPYADKKGAKPNAGTKKIWRCYIPCALMAAVSLGFVGMAWWLSPELSHLFTYNTFWAIVSAGTLLLPFYGVCAYALGGILRREKNTGRKWILRVCLCLPLLLLLLMCSVLVEINADALRSSLWISTMMPFLLLFVFFAKNNPAAQAAGEAMQPKAIWLTLLPAWWMLLYICFLEVRFLMER